ncbi:GtrA family protein [Actinomyces lilanjuaniae]|uniref:GtrA family protein n=2 Tax=Actinomyces lilanjuaniae TaxID=2321394 RepID=A0ABN5PPH9_9ACTO|nr:GtrA family protein [Actinomyces lilanjuaniae]
MGAERTTMTTTNRATSTSWLNGSGQLRLRTPSAPAARSAPDRFLGLVSAIHRYLPSPLRRRVPVSFIGYALINGSGFFLDIACLWFLYERLHWFYPLAVTVGYAIAGTYSLLLNRWLNFQSHGHLVAQGTRYAVGLVSQYVIFILGLSSLLHWMGMGAELARVLSACCEGVYLYAVTRLWVFRDSPEPEPLTH